MSSSDTFTNVVPDPTSSERLDELLADILDDESEMLADDTPFDVCPSWDSLKHVELIVGIETRFGLDLSAAEITSIKSKRSAREILASRGCR
jgi:acyl carrier protein